MQDLSRIEPLGAACTDAERRAANRLHDRLRAAGHEAWVETVWVRPRWELSLGLHCAPAVVGGLVAIAAPIPGLVVAAIGALGLVAEALGRPGPVRYAMRRRATQNVLVEPRDPGRVALLLVAPYDAPRGGIVRGDRARAWAAALGGRVPSLGVWLAACGLAVAATAAARVAGADGPVLGAAQLVPTVILLLAAAAAADAAMAAPTQDNASAVAAAIVLLGRELPARFSPGLVLYGGGGPAALRAHLRRERLDPTRALVVELGPGGDTPRWSARHPHLRRAAATAGVAEGRRAPVRRLPTLVIAGEDAATAAATVLAALDAELAE